MVSPSPKRAAMVTCTADAEADQQFGHGAHICQARNIGQRQGFGGQQRTPPSA